tara:strand:- start:357 stop:944 length:588 start_codon:yes stop_codon:yes gene_type:complete
MSLTSPLANIYHKGKFGDYEDKNENDILKITEIKNLLIVQIVQYKNSKISFENIDIDNLKLKDKPLVVVKNNDTRILWNGPKNWLLVSKKKNLLKDILNVFDETDFAITDISHSRAIIEIEGKDVKEVLKKGCPYNFNILEKNNSINSIYNGISFTLDVLESNPNKFRLFTLRSFGESFYHSITDASLEFGFKSI